MNELCYTHIHACHTHIDNYTEKMIKLLVLVSLLSVAFGHTCLVFPVQRGGLNDSQGIPGKL